jgi:3-deoxy-D-manno-octulosonic-acid transferase
MNLTSYRIAYSISWILSPLVFPFSKKFRRGFLGRRGLVSRLKNAKLQWSERGLTPSPYWFHFASAGELEQAIPIAEEIKRRLPEASIFFSYFSPSGEKAVRAEKLRREKAGRPLPWDAADYLPFDLPWKVSQILTLLKPKALVVIHREIWPELLTQTHKNKVPLFLFAAFFPNHKTKILKLWAPYLSLFKQIGTVGEASSQLLLESNRSLPVIAVGDSRVERVLERKTLQRSAPPWGAFLEGKSLFMGASLWKEDWEALKPILEKTAKELPAWRVCLVPHEPEEAFVELIKKWGKEKGIAFRRFSHFLEVPDEVSPLIIDSVGLLAELYRFSSLTFVGGSFKSRVHNVLEPAAYQNAIVTGPFIQNSFEATEMNHLKAGLVQTHSSQELTQTLLERLTHPALVKSEGAKAHQYLRERQGTAKKYCDLLELNDSKDAVIATKAKPSP